MQISIEGTHYDLNEFGLKRHGEEFARKHAEWTHRLPIDSTCVLIWKRGKNINADVVELADITFDRKPKKPKLTINFTRPKIDRTMGIPKSYRTEDDCCLDFDKLGATDVKNILHIQILPPGTFDSHFIGLESVRKYEAIKADAEQFARRFAQPDEIVRSSSQTPTPFVPPAVEMQVSSPKKQVGLFNWLFKLFR